MARVLPARALLTPRTHWRNRRRVRRRASGRTVAYNLRFPGQLFDGQAGLHQNYFRDYDPATGSYIESDPIGIQGGVNTYAYVRNAPTMEYDVDGLEAVSYLLHHRPHPPEPLPPGVSDQVKKILCKLINDRQGDMNCVFNRMNADRKNRPYRGGPIDPNSWNNPDLRQAENFATAAADDSYQYPAYTWFAHTEFGIFTYQYDVQPIYRAFGGRTSPVSDAAYSAGMAGLDLYHQGRAAPLQWCHDCTNK